ncbi:hypothetical protein C8R47DRAFT_1081733 [Mycena vitilis]|nr:hypothetical protein C8R47DRAFT_1081733 [Mycena vitilis]
MIGVVRFRRPFAFFLLKSSLFSASQSARPPMKISITAQDTKVLAKAESMDVGARPPAATDPYAAAARALEEAQRAFTSALATPMVPVYVAQELRDEITALKIAAEKDRTTIAGLGKAADEAAKGHKAELERKTNAFRRILAKEKELRAAAVTEREAIKTQCAALEAENQALLEERKSLTLSLQGMIQTMQREPVPVPVKPTGLIPASWTVATAPPSITVSKPAVPVAQHASYTINSVPPRKRQRTESAPTAPRAAASVANIDTTSTDAPARFRCAGFPPRLVKAPIRPASTAGMLGGRDGDLPRSGARSALSPLLHDLIPRTTLVLFLAALAGCTWVFLAEYVVRASR